MDLNEIFKYKESNISFSISAVDLMSFAKTLAEQTAKEILERYDEKMFTREEVCAKFDVSETTLWRWSKDGIINRKKIGNRIYYSETEIKRLCSTKK